MRRLTPFLASNDLPPNGSVLTGFECRFAVLPEWPAGPAQQHEGSDRQKNRTDRTLKENEPVTL